jgi:hypothetical protein
VEPKEARTLSKRAGRGGFSPSAVPIFNRLI